MDGNRVGWLVGMGVGAAVLAVLALSSAAAGAWVLWPRPAPVVRVRPPSHFPVRGIDVSHHQGAVDWSAVAATGTVDFVFLKATEGTTHRDRRFARNWRQARAAGLRVGAYHYLSLCRDGEDQARHFISRVPKVEGGLPPVVDLEPDGRCNHGSRLAKATTVLEDWLTAVEAHYGRTPIVYTSASFYRSHLAGAELDAHLWAAAYSREPRTPGRPWHFWQYTDRGALAGIRGPVDHNVFRGTVEELEAL